MMQKTDNNRGFTLVETLVAITILMIGVIGPLNTAVKGISDGLFAANQIAANYLAQEAMETIVWQRNEDTLVTSTGWSEYLGTLSCSGGANICLVKPYETVSNGVVRSGSCSDHGLPIPGNYDECDLIFNTGSSQYVQPVTGLNTVGTVFRRRVYLVPTPSSGIIEQIKVVVRVDWSNRSDPRHLTLVERLYPKK